MNQGEERSKVPEVTLVFWIIKILATTLGETGGDAVSMSLDLGYAISSFIFVGVFVVAVIAQISAKAFHPWLYWLVVIATTTAGTTMADFADRSLGIGYPGGASLLFLLLMISLAGMVPVGGIHFSQHRGDAEDRNVLLGRRSCFRRRSALPLATGWRTPTGSVIKAARWYSRPGLSLIAAAYFWSNVSRTLLFWAAFILTRPLGATLGDFLDKPLDQGGLAFSRFYATGILAAVIVACLVFLPQRAGSHAGKA